MSKGTSLELYFGNNNTPGLYRTVVKAPGHDEPIIGVRGPLFLSPSLPFIWSNSCIALSLLFVSAVSYEAKGHVPVLPLLEGDSSSPAGSIGRLMSKGNRSWLHDIFGADASGRPLLGRMILLGNARGRRQGPITATLRSTYLCPKAIKIFVDGQDISKDVSALNELATKLFSEFLGRKDSRVKKSSLAEALISTPCAA